MDLKSRSGSTIQTFTHLVISLILGWWLKCRFWNVPIILGLFPLCTCAFFKNNGSGFLDLKVKESSDWVWQSRLVVFLLFFITYYKPSGILLYLFICSSFVSLIDQFVRILGLVLFHQFDLTGVIEFIQFVGSNPMEVFVWVVLLSFLINWFLISYSFKGMSRSGSF